MKRLKFFRLAKCLDFAGNFIPRIYDSLTKKEFPHVDATNVRI